MGVKKGDGLHKLAALGAFYKSTGGDVVFENTPQGFSVTFVPGLQGDIENLDISAIHDAVLMEDGSPDPATLVPPAP